MTRATRKLAEAAKSGHLKESEVSSTGGKLRKRISKPPLQVTVEKLEANLYTAPSPPVDLMIRTSGEKRLSDFLLWQADNAVIHFTSVLWPEFSLWHLLAAIFYYQVFSTCRYSFTSTTHNMSGSLTLCIKKLKLYSISNKISSS